MENIYEYCNELSGNREAGGFIDKLNNCERGKKYFGPEGGGNVFSQMLIGTYKMSQLKTLQHAHSLPCKHENLRFQKTSCPVTLGTYNLNSLSHNVYFKS
jgi:hypothetical protein